ncbi:MAG TPA: lytic transglycosylase domain-containing protein [Anaerovoracaceae bacterium]|nr:lytic transglycosylase domain-containing protein [Anaerovoracaceae bacterium]
MAKKLISVWLSVTILLFSTITIFAEENVEGQFLNRNIDINGNRVENYYLEHPLFLHQGFAYVPLTEEMGEILGFTTEMDWESRTLKILKKVPARTGLAERKLKSNLNNLPAVILEDVTVLIMTEEVRAADPGPVIQGALFTPFRLDPDGHVTVFNDSINEDFIKIPQLKVQKLDTDDYPLIQANDILYLPVRAFVDNCFQWDAFYDNFSGLYVSTEAGIDAIDFFDKDESDYNRGLVNYILSVNGNLSPGWAAMLVFIFKHEAEVNGIDELLLMAMAQKESTFRADVVGKGGPVGLLQIMPQTAKAYGISRDQLFDPHINVEFGTKYIKDKLDQYGNDKTVALSAYNQGGMAISRGSYSTRYANNITGAERSITQYLTNNGYGLGK